MEGVDYGGVLVLTLCRGLDKRAQYKGHVVSWVETVPEGAGGEGSQASAEARFLALRRNAEVDVVAQPVVGVLVPVG